ncbi:hypothetical protein ADK57_32250 [Streptomyces sp. MMG1533]|uniref:dienelactone hydrolase family protein n=1 Tax=Streptomyces sp. MMG1533 TaxID=1415546 RepID=UPI0006B06D64|nr:dienelactone hydrolase family protein [Streptomyces sp. MMG1533]KOU59802.1 hypothetical protein ADK57_32250 [Streptomyces sp. MMG1533]
MDQAFPRIQPDDVRIGGGLRAAEIRLGGVPRGAVVLLTEAGDPVDTAEVMNRLAEQGYETFAAEVSGDGGAPDALRALLGRAGARGWAGEQVGLVGYGVGAQVALRAAEELELGAAVSVAPTRLPKTLALRTPWLGLVGVPDAQAEAAVRRVSRELALHAPVHTELVGYRGLGGSFHHDPADQRAHAAAFDCWQRTVEWLNLRVVPRLTPLARQWRARRPAGVGTP